MRIVIAAFGGICLAYYVLLLSVKMDFSIIWLAAGMLLIGGSVWGHFLPKWVQITLAGFFIVGFLIFAVTEMMIFRAMVSEEPENPEYLIVLGAQVRGETPSRALQKRLLKAEEFLKENPKTIAILSGGQGPGEEISEAEAMGRFLEEAGIRANRFILEDQSTSTLENLKFSGKLIDSLDVTVGILTNNFHVFRATRLAKAQGYTKVYGICAPSDPIYQVHYLVREFFALVKEKVKGNI